MDTIAESMRQNFCFIKEKNENLADTIDKNEEKKINIHRNLRDCTT